MYVSDFLQRDIAMHNTIAPKRQKYFYRHNGLKNLYFF